MWGRCPGKADCTLINAHRHDLQLVSILNIFSYPIIFWAANISGVCPLQSGPSTSCWRRRNEREIKPISATTVKRHVKAWSHLSFGHKISCYGHVLEEDGEVESSVTFSVCDGGICSVSHQVDHHGKVALPYHRQKPQTALETRF